MLTNARFLVVGAHPDDIEFGCLGTLLKYGTDATIRCIILTAGEFSDNGIDRGTETKKALAAVGITDVVVLGFPDGNLYGNLVSNRQTVAAIEHHVKAFKPTVVLTHTPYDTHQDHRATYDAVMSAIRMTPVTRVTWAGPSSTREFSPNLLVNIDSQWDKKLAALAKHESQAHRSYMTIESLEAAHADRRSTMLGYGKHFEALYIKEQWA